jgi:hypothetical protein
MRVLIGLLASIFTMGSALADTVSNEPVPYFTHFIDSNGPESTNYHVIVGVKPNNPLVS